MYQAVTALGAAAATLVRASPTARTLATARSLTNVTRAPPREPRRPHGRADPARARPTRSLRARARAARRAARARRHLRTRAPRSAPAGPALRAPPPCLEGRRQLVTCLSQLARALLEACDRFGNAEQSLVELADEPGAIAVQQERDEQAAQQLARRLPQLLREICALLRRRTEQRGAAHGRRPRPVAFAERRLQRVAKLLAAERLGLEERELPAVEGVPEVRVFVGCAEPDANVARHRGAERIEPRGLAGRRRGRDRKHRADSIRAPVEPLEENRPGRDGSG